jgi:hypothetical protein
VLRRFHGSAKIDATRLSRDVDLIASSVVQHLAGLLDAKVTITVEIEAEIPSGAPDNVVRTGDRELPDAEVRQPGVRGKLKTVKAAF